MNKSIDTLRNSGFEVIELGKNFNLRSLGTGVTVATDLSQKQLDSYARGVEDAIAHDIDKAYSCPIRETNHYVMTTGEELEGLAY